MNYDVGDLASLRHEVRVDGTLTNATVALSVTAPDGTTSTPSVSNPSTGVYTASVSVTQAGPWVYVWTMSGAVVDVAGGGFSAQNPQAPTYASLAELKSYLAVTDVADDAQMLDSLVTASRGIEQHCGRRFYPQLTASARVFHPKTAWLCKVDDFWTSTGLVIALDPGDTGTYTTTLSTYSLEPLNGVVNGEAGWPYYRIVAVNQWFRCGRFPSVQVTAKWGWASVPGPVKQACVYLASEAYKMKGSPFGVASFDQFGPIRMRENPRVMAMLAPYCDSPVLMA